MPGFWNKGKTRGNSTEGYSWVKHKLRFCNRLPWFKPEVTRQKLTLYHQRIIPWVNQGQNSTSKMAYLD